MRTFQPHEVKHLTSSALRGLPGLGDYEMSGPLGSTLVFTLLPEGKLMRCNVVVEAKLGDGDVSRRVRTLFTLDEGGDFRFEHGSGVGDKEVKDLMIDHFALWLTDREDGPDEFLRFKEDLSKSSFWDRLISDVKNWRDAAIVMLA